MKVVHCACIPSDQPKYHVTITLPDGSKLTLSEQAIQEPCCQEIVAEGKRQGYDFKEFFIPGTQSGNVPQLIQECKNAMAWLKTFPADTRYSVSNHSNSGTSTVQYIYPQLSLAADMAWGTAQGKDLAARTGFTFRTPEVRTLEYMSVMKALGPNHSILHETGEHQIAVDAAYLWKYRRFDGIMIARAFLHSIGATIIDGPVPSDVVVPAGTKFDKYRPGTVTPPTPTPPPIPAPHALPILRVTSPMMHDTITGPLTGDINIVAFPIHWLQHTLAIHPYKMGFTYVVNGVTYDIRNLVSDGVYGPITAGADMHFEAEHYWLGGQHEVVDGIVDDNDWAKYRTV